MELVEVAAWTLALPLLAGAGGLSSWRAAPRMAAALPALALVAVTILLLFIGLPAAETRRDEGRVAGSQAEALAWTPRLGTSLGWLRAHGGQPLPAGTAETTRFDADADGLLALPELEVAAAKRGQTWLSIGAPEQRGSLWVWLRLGVEPLRAGLLLAIALLLAAAAGANAEQQGRAGGPSLCFLATACFAATWADEPLLGVVCFQVGVIAACALHQAGSHEGAPLRLGVGTLVLLSGSAALGLASAIAFERGVGGPWVSAALTTALVAPLAFLLTRRGPAQAWAGGLLGLGALGLTGLSLVANAWEAARLSPEGWRPPAPFPGARGLTALVLVGLAAVFVARALSRVLRGERMSDALGGGLLAVLSSSIALAALGQGVPGAALACSGALALGVTALAIDAARSTLGASELGRWRGLRRLHPRAGVAFVLGAALLTPLPGAPMARALSALSVQTGAAKWVAATAAALILTLAWLLWHCALRVVRGAPPAELRAGVPHGARAALILAVAGVLLAGLPLAGSLPAPLWRGGAGAARFASLASLAVIGLALLSARSATPLASRRTLLDLDVHFESYAPQRRIVQPLLSLSRKAARVEERWFEARTLRVLGAFTDAGARLTQAPELLTRAPADPAPASPPEVADADTSQAETSAAELRQPDPTPPPEHEHPSRGAITRVLQSVGGVDALLFLILLGCALAAALSF